MPADLPEKNLLRVEEAAKYFDVSNRTIYLWIEHGLLEAEKYNNVIRIPRESIKSFRLNSKLRPLD